MFRRVVGFCLLTLVSPSVLAQAPLAISGVEDRVTYTDTASFSVPTVPGYVYGVFLDGKRVPADMVNAVTAPDYHEISVWRTNASNATVTNHSVRFIVRSSSRGSPEKGLSVWTPYPPVPSTAEELAGGVLHVVAPGKYPLGLDIPVAAWVDDGNDRIIRGNGWVVAAGFESAAFRLVRGHGSGFLPGATTAGVVNFNAGLAGLGSSRPIEVEPATTWVAASGTLAADTVWPADSRIALTADLTIPAGRTLTIEAGSVVRVSPLVNIVNSGGLIVNGTAERPVVFTPITRPAPEQHAGAWGGLVMRGGRLTANWAFFTGAGGATSFDFSPGASHRNEQALLLAHSGAVVSLTNCFLINQAGQIANGYNSDFTYDHCLLQRAITSGESVGGTIIVNRSAIVEFPSIDGVYSASIADADYDGIYFTTGTHILKDSLIGFAKDDAIDSGSGGAGTVLVTNCWVESALHEALAWSGGGRQTWTYDTVLMNSGQGIEAGWTEGSEDKSPDCFAERILSTANSVGARFGDNYDWTYYGFLRITNSLLLHNYRDIFAKTWNTSGGSWNTNQWVDRLAQMDIRGNALTRPDSRFAQNSTWAAETNGSRLAAFMSTPALAEVGVGIATWAQQFTLSTVFDGVPVRLSSFTTHPVGIGYAWMTATGQVASGTLVFAPGETLKRIYPAGFNLEGIGSVSLRLADPEGCEITGTAEVTFTGSVPARTLGLVQPGAQLGMERLGEGVPVRMSGPAAHAVTLRFRFLASGDQVLRQGEATFAPGETLIWIDPPVPAPAEGMVRFDIAEPVGATISGVPYLWFVRSEVPEPPAPLALISKGARWNYLDDGSNQGIAWRQPGFQDGSWASGKAQLGFGEQDEQTPISRTNKVTGTTNITFYFRSTFTVTNPAAYNNLSMWLLRDDGGVVYLNDREVYRTANMPAGAVFYNTFTTDTGENSVDVATVAATNLAAGLNVAAVEIHQRDLGSSDLSFDLELIANPKPAGTAPQELQYGVFGGELVLGWGDGSFGLEQAEAVSGPWDPVPGVSPVRVSLGAGQAYFRLRR